MSELFTKDDLADGYIFIDCEQTGLSDNTAGKIGKHAVYLQYGSQDKELTPELLAAAREFAAREFSRASTPTPREPIDCEPTFAEKLSAMDPQERATKMGIGEYIEGEGWV